MMDKMLEKLAVMAIVAFFVGMVVATGMLMMSGFVVEGAVMLVIEVMTAYVVMS